jgi:hypothetical protein
MDTEGKKPFVRTARVLIRTALIGQAVLFLLAASPPPNPFARPRLETLKPYLTTDATYSELESLVKESELPFSEGCPAGVCLNVRLDQEHDGHNLHLHFEDGKLTRALITNRGNVVVERPAIGGTK